MENKHISKLITNVKLFSLISSSRIELYIYHNKINMRIRFLQSNQK
jgi:hypothetical protein